MKVLPLIAALFAGMAAPAMTVAEPLPSVQEVRRFAEDVVVGTQPGGRLVKWLRAPTVRLETMVPGPRDKQTGRAIPIPAETPMQHYMRLRRHVMSLKELTGMPIRLMPRDIGSGGDIVVTVVPRTAMGQLPLGLPNDSERLRPSIFNETSMLTELSALDRILIRTVYDPRMTTGMNLGRFRESAEPVIGTYMSSD